MALHTSRSGRSASFAADVSDGGSEPRLLGVHWSIEDVEYPVPWHLVREIRREFDPDFVPLFRRRVFQTSTGSVFSDGRFCLGRYVPFPESEPEDLGIQWPAYKLGGIYFRGPVVCALVLDPQDFAHAEAEGNPDWRGPNSESDWKRVRSQFLPFTGKVVREMRETRHRLARTRHIDIRRALTVNKRLAKAAQREQVKDGLRLQLRDDWKRINRIRQAETEYDRQRAMVPREVAPMVYHHTA